MALERYRSWTLSTVILMQGSLSLISIMACQRILKSDGWAASWPLKLLWTSLSLAAHFLLGSIIFGFCRKRLVTIPKKSKSGKLAPIEQAERRGSIRATYPTTCATTSASDDNAGNRLPTLPLHLSEMLPVDDPVLPRQHAVSEATLQILRASTMSTVMSPPEMLMQPKFSRARTIYVCMPDADPSQLAPDAVSKLKERFEKHFPGMSVLNVNCMRGSLLLALLVMDVNTEEINKAHSDTLSGVPNMVEPESWLEWLSMPVHHRDGMVVGIKGSADDGMESEVCIVLSEQEYKSAVARIPLRCAWSPEEVNIKASLCCAPTCVQTVECTPSGGTYEYCLEVALPWGDLPAAGGHRFTNLLQLCALCTTSRRLLGSCLLVILPPSAVRLACEIDSLAEVKGLSDIFCCWVNSLLFHLQQQQQQQQEQQQEQQQQQGSGAAEGMKADVVLWQYGCNLLQTLVERGSLELAEEVVKLLGRCQDLFQRTIMESQSHNFGARTLIHSAVLSGKRSVVSAVLSWADHYKLPFSWLSEDAGGLTPLHVATMVDSYNGTMFDCLTQSYDNQDGVSSPRDLMIGDGLMAHGRLGMTPYQLSCLLSEHTIGAGRRTEPTIGAGKCTEPTIGAGKPTDDASTNRLATYRTLSLGQALSISYRGKEGVANSADAGLRLLASTSTPQACASSKEALLATSMCETKLASSLRGTQRASSLTKTKPVRSLRETQLASLLRERQLATSLRETQHALPASRGSAVQCFWDTVLGFSDASKEQQFNLWRLKGSQVVLNADLVTRLVLTLIRAVALFRRGQDVSAIHMFFLASLAASTSWAVLSLRRWSTTKPAYLQAALMCVQTLRFIVIHMEPIGKLGSVVLCINMVANVAFEPVLFRGDVLVHTIGCICGCYLSQSYGYTIMVVLIHSLSTFLRLAEEWYLRSNIFPKDAKSLHTT